MAYVDGNDITLGLRGKFGHQFVFRKFGKATIATRKPESSGSNTPAQQRHRERFRVATFYAKQCMMRPDLKAEYEAIAKAKETWSAFATAIGDYLTPVEIKNIDASAWRGGAGSPVLITVNDSFKVKTIIVTINDSDGNLIESGNATLAASGYVYYSKTSLPGNSHAILRVEVMDRPGRSVLEEVQVA